MAMIAVVVAGFSTLRSRCCFAETVEQKHIIYILYLHHVISAYFMLDVFWVDAFVVMRWMDALWYLHIMLHHVVIPHPSRV